MLYIMLEDNTLARFTCQADTPVAVYAMVLCTCQRCGLKKKGRPLSGSPLINVTGSSLVTYPHA